MCDGATTISEPGMREIVLLPPRTMVERRPDSDFGPWWSADGDHFSLEGWPGIPEDCIRAFVDGFGDPEDLEQLIAYLRQEELIS